MAEASGNQLPSGYDEDFVNAVEDEFLCVICRLTLKKMVLTRCGHRFCKECLEEHLRRQEIRREPLTCPADRYSLDRNKDVFPDKATERKILSFAIRCPSGGCEWTGELRSKESHLSTCLFKVIPCTNDNCHEEVQRQLHKQHVIITCQWRILECSHCCESHPECLMQDHIQRCSKFPVPCQNSCGLSISREMIPSHIADECPLTIICCPYSQMGCKIMMKRREEESHLQSALRVHLDLACIKLTNTEVKLNNTVSKLKETQSKLRETEIKLSYTDDLKRELKMLQEEFKEKSMKEKIVMMKTESTDYPLMFIWKIDNFSERMREAKKGKNRQLESAPFYTENYGYKLKVRLYPNGFGEGHGMLFSIFIVIMRGEYDAILPWPFKRTVKFTLIDQQENSDKKENIGLANKPGDNPRVYGRPQMQDNAGFGKSLPQHKLQTGPYVVDDALFMQVEVGPP